MGGSEGQGGAGSFALVSYLAGPLAEFLDRLRQELAPGCFAKAHITLLPPRALAGPPEAAWRELSGRLRDFSPFDVELGAVELFPVSQVIYISVMHGYRQLRQMHEALNAGAAWCRETYEYHPHITLAQDIAPAIVQRNLALAAGRWREFEAPRTFTVDKLAFVQSTPDKTWRDLYTTDLAGHALEETR